MMTGGTWTDVYLTSTALSTLEPAVWDVQMPGIEIGSSKRRNGVCYSSPWLRNTESNSTVKNIRFRHKTALECVMVEEASITCICSKNIGAGRGLHGDPLMILWNTPGCKRVVAALKYMFTASCGIFQMITIAASKTSAPLGRASPPSELGAGSGGLGGFPLTLSEETAKIPPTAGPYHLLYLNSSRYSHSERARRNAQTFFYKSACTPLHHSDCVC